MSSLASSVTWILLLCVFLSFFPSFILSFCYSSLFLPSLRVMNAFSLASFFPMSLFFFSLSSPRSLVFLSAFPLPNRSCLHSFLPHHIPVLVCTSISSLSFPRFFFLSFLFFINKESVHMFLASSSLTVLASRPLRSIPSITPHFPFRFFPSVRNGLCFLGFLPHHILALRPLHPIFFFLLTLCPAFSSLSSFFHHKEIRL